MTIGIQCPQCGNVNEIEITSIDFRKEGSALVEGNASRYTIIFDGNCPICTTNLSIEARALINNELNIISYNKRKEDSN